MMRPLLCRVKQQKELSGSREKVLRESEFAGTVRSRGGFANPCVTLLSLLFWTMLSLS